MSSTWVQPGIRPVALTRQPLRAGRRLTERGQVVRRSTTNAASPTELAAARASIAKGSATAHRPENPNASMNRTNRSASPIGRSTSRHRSCCGRSEITSSRSTERGRLEARVPVLSGCLVSSSTTHRVAPCTANAGGHPAHRREAVAHPSSKRSARYRQDVGARTRSITEHAMHKFHIEHYERLARPGHPALTAAADQQCRAGRCRRPAHRSRRRTTSQPWPPSSAGPRSRHRHRPRCARHVDQARPERDGERPPHAGGDGCIQYTAHAGPPGHCARSACSVRSSGGQRLHEHDRLAGSDFG